MTTSISSSRLKQIIKSEISDVELRKRLSRLGSPHLDTLIREAGVVLEDRLRSVSGQNEYGVKLVDAAFGPGDKTLRYSEHSGEQEGVKMLYRGAMQFIRNPPMHKLVDYPIDTARTLIRLIDSLLLLLSETSQSPGKQPSKRGTRDKWWEEKLLDYMKQNFGEAEYRVAAELYDWSKNTADKLSFGTGGRSGSFSFKYSGKHQVATIFSVYTDGRLTITFGALRKIFTKADINEFRKQLMQIPSLSQVVRGIAQYPSARLKDILKTESEIQDFKQSVLWLQERLDHED